MDGFRENFTLGLISILLLVIFAMEAALFQQLSEMKKDIRDIGSAAYQAQEEAERARIIGDDIRSDIADLKYTH